ncbi:GlcNAc-transferase family protein [uncultured Arcticibacterium sp.]|uniref:GlcNAc-transferase family protein n=1 Tax=uncultured Arcticibacterium sp. TaxID=2173042 RepID=UPI0030F4F8CB
MLIKDSNTGENTIFVQIASYRDPQLVPTLDDLFEKAEHDENLRVTVAWQTSDEDTWDNLDKYLSDERVNVVKVPYQEAKGVCWARNLVQQHYNGEKYTLQLDSHHRFVEGWDVLLIDMLESLRNNGIKKPLLTAYIPSFDPENDPEGRAKEPWKMDFDRFTPEGVVFFLPSTIEHAESLTLPVPARFYSAHFAFTIGLFSQEVQHDPSFYFHGEEISIAVRAYTHGYDLFHPHKIVAWHEYTRKGRIKHWDDEKEWFVTNTYTHKRVKQLFGIDGEEKTNDFGLYGFGRVRTVADYEKFAGIRFKDRGVQKHTLDNNLAPNPEVEDYENSFYNIFEHCIDVHKTSLPEKDYEFLVVAFLDEKGADIYRKDADKDEIKELFNTTGEWLNIWRKYTGPVPSKWLIWPYSTSKGWCDRIERSL